MFQDLAGCLQKVPDSFDPGELAFLALTSKPELQVRDRLAWQLHQAMQGRALVAREWRHTDLAIIDTTGTARALVEAKAFYTFDALSLRHLPRYEGYLASDVAKAHRLREKYAPDAEVFVLAVVTHVDGASTVAPEAGLSHVVKYWSYLQRRTDLEDARRKIAAALSKLHPTVDPVTHCDRDRAFGLEVTVDCWLCGPISPEGRRC